MTSITVIIPAFNEEKNILSSFLNAKNAVERFFSDYEILIIDDHSRDDTFKKIEEIKKKHKFIKIIRNKKNLGLGSVLKQGYKLAKKNYVVYFAGDNQIPLESFAGMLKLINSENFYCIISFHSNMIKTRPLKKYIISKIYNFIISISFNLKVNYTTGPTIYNSKILKDINCHSKNRFVPTEILIKYLKKNKNFINYDMKIKERDSGESMGVDYIGIKDVVINYFKLVFYYYSK